ncbi:DEAD/DEAH box helicase [Halorarum salinum]|uniref:DEAD/DEAH box helicase n=1 Tax=Halorarum salinum TaxID=2743089 RepID=A0A7D5Q9S7_9EURY|nr:DEAD/DEAH box helicase [Halobaculum salinum]QLG61936.1 DEAD/DEAH box helicase [Halobaculum salinum]
MSTSSEIELLTSKYGLVSTYVDHLRNDRDIDSLWRTQFDALNAGLLNAESFLMVAEAGTGKTLAAEFAIVDNATAVEREISVYLIPYRSLAEEKTQTFRETIGDTFDLSVETSLGGDRMEPVELFAADILVMTYEKFDYHLRNHGGYINEIGLVVIDEFHTLSNERRGPNLEVVATKLRTEYPEIRVVGLSATAPNCEQVAKWLAAEWSDSGTWRKCSLWEGTHVVGSDELNLYREDEPITESVSRYVEQVPHVNPALEFLSGDPGRQALIFAPIRRDAKRYAEAIASFLRDHPRSGPVEVDRVVTRDLEERISDAADRRGEVQEALEACIPHGVGFHHAGLNDTVKRCVVGGLEDGSLRVVVSTTTLGAGINLPIDRVFITKPRLGGSGEYGRPMTTGEYKNLVGRSGRPQYGDDPGEAVLYAENALQQQDLYDNFLTGDIEPVTSAINPIDPELVLDLIREYEGPDRIYEFLSDTFHGATTDLPESETIQGIEATVEELIAQGMVDSGQSSGRFDLTDLGYATSKQLIAPATVHAAVRYLRDVKSLDKFDVIDFLTVLGASPLLDQCRLYRRGGERGIDLEPIRDRLPLPDSDDLSDETLANALVTAQVIADWLRGEELGVSFTRRRITSSRTPSDVSERAAPMFARGIKTLTEILEEAEDPLVAVFNDQLEQLEYQVRYGLDAGGAAFARHHIATERRWIDHMRDGLDIEHPSEIATGPMFRLFGEMPGQQAFKYTRRAINEFCEEPELSRRNTLLDARSEGADTGAIRSLFETTQTVFENHCEERLGNCNGLQYRSFDEQGQDRYPEGELTILNDDQSTPYEVDGTPLVIAVECKSKEDLEEGEISVDNATDVVRKADTQPFQLTIGTPQFASGAHDEARRQGVLLLPVAAFTTLMIHAERSTIQPETFAELFTSTGHLTRREVKRILGER